jgi:acyl-CoA reductase-like NAD-dependent aldehyde dehydrogenase
MSDTSIQTQCWTIRRGYYVEPTILKGTNDMRIFQEEIFGPVMSVTRSTRALPDPLSAAR